MSDVEAQRRAGEHGALIQARDDLATLVVTGKDRVAWLDGLVTCALKEKRAGEGAYGLATNKTGKILAELFIVVDKEALWIGVLASLKESIAEHFEKHLIMEDAEIEDASERSAWIFAHGPYAHEMVSMARARGARSALADTTGHGTAIVSLDRADKTALARAMVERAAENGALADAEAWEHVRVAWGAPKYGADFDDTTLPQEAGLEQLAVSFSKGCYLGQEAVFMLENRGHAKKLLMQIRVDGAEPVSVGSEIADDEGFGVGQVTSSAPNDERSSLALGYVKYKIAKPSQALEIRGRSAIVIDRAGKGPSQ